MALTDQGFRLRVNLVDNSGYGTTRTYDLVAADADAAATAAGVILTALAAVTDCTIAGYEIVNGFYEDSPTLPGAGVQVENQALLVLELADISKSATVSIPGPKISIFQATSGAGADIVNPGNSAVIAYWQLFDGSPATVSDGESAVALRQGHRRHVASRYH